MNIKKSRTKAAVTNVIVSILVQFGNLLLAFAQRTILIKTMGNKYVGVDGLFSNILTLLSLAELGFGSAIVYSMYAPMARNDKAVLNALLKLYGKIYNIIGIAVLSVGTLLAPFLDFFIKESPDIPRLTLIYLMYVLNTGVSYFLIYKSSIITVAQDNYVVVLNKFIFHGIQNIIQIVILLLFKNYELFYFITILCTIAGNISISHIANKRYPYIKEKSTYTISDEEKQSIKKNIYAMFVHKVGFVVVYGTDNLLISKFVSVVAVGLYSNYTLIITAINSLIGKLFSSITASVGNLGVTKDKKDSYIVFKRVMFLNYIVAGYCSLILYFTLNPFISIWLGDEYTFGNGIVALIVIVFYLGFIRKTVLLFKDAYGLFWYDRFKPYIESAVNLVVSIILGLKIGISGIFIGTIVSTLSVAYWWEAYVLYKYAFKLSLGKYFGLALLYTTVSFVPCIPCYFIERTMGQPTILSLFLRIAVYSVIAVGVYCLAFFRSEEFKYYCGMIKRILFRKKSH